MAKHTTGRYFSLGIKSLKLYLNIGPGHWLVKGEDLKAEVSVYPDPLCITFNWEEPIQLKCTIFFIQQPCNYGGFRYWLKCPICQQKKGKLYLIGSELKCRLCGDLTYHSSQSRSHADKIFGPLAKLWAEDRRLERERKKISQQKRKQYQYKGKLIKRLQTRSYNGAADTRLFDNWYQRVTGRSS